ncbi:MAG: FkbM family methyltransferase [Rhodothermales bacterium]|nr:FkbM family methyltransferase [Rhodothermales bacterium]
MMIDDNRFFTWLREHDPKLSCFFDVGAFKGGWTSRVCKCFPDATYHLFEPQSLFDSGIRAALAERKLQHHVIVNECAVGRRRGQAELGIMGEGARGSSLLIPERQRDELQLFKVPLICLDDYVAENAIDFIDFMKMDIQGGELNALRGATTVLPRTKYLHLETWLVKSYGGQTPSIHEIMSFLRDYDFTPLDFLGQHRTPSGLLVHVDIVYMNVNHSPFPPHFHRGLLRGGD